MSETVWVIDMSSILQVRYSFGVEQRPQVFARLSALVAEGRLRFPKQVADELRRGARPGTPDPYLEWAESVEAGKSVV